MLEKRVRQSKKSQEKKKIRKKIIRNFESVGLAEYLQYLHSPFAIFWTNFLAGISRGFGIIVGMSVVVGIVIWILSRLVAFPLIGEYSQKITDSITEYMQSTNYEDEFAQMQKTLEQIEKNTRSMEGK